MTLPRSVVLSALLLAAAASTPARAAPASTMRIKAQKQGELKGGVTQPGREGSLRVLSLQHEIATPRDGSLQATGKRTHKPIVLVVEVDRALPLLYQSLATSETLARVEIKLWRASPQGAEVHYQSVVLTGASIVSLELRSPAEKEPPTAVLALRYQKIEWTWTDTGVTTSDEWEVAPSKGL